MKQTHKDIIIYFTMTSPSEQAKTNKVKTLGPLYSNYKITRYNKDIGSTLFLTELNKDIKQKQLQSLDIGSSSFQKGKTNKQIQQKR
jgi:hypothetical protein